MDVRPQLVRVVRRAETVRTPGEPFPGIRRLVVARHDRLGDLVATVPALAALRTTYPAATLALLVDPARAPFARMVQGVDEVLELPVGAAALRRQLEAFAPELLICISNGADVPWAGARARIPHRVGTGYRLYSPLFERRVNERRSGGERHEVEYALSFAHRSGAAGGPARFRLRPGRLAQDAVGAWLRDHHVDGRFAMLHPGSGGSCPPWPVAHFVRLAGRLLERGLSVVFSVGPEDGAVVATLDTAPAPVRAAPRFTGGVRELAVLLARSAVTVTNSTGPLHLSAAMGAPTLGLYPPWPTCGPSRWGPYGDGGWALVAANDEARRWSRGRRRASGDALMAELDPDVVSGVATAIADGQTPVL